MDYNLHYKNWHTDSVESLERDIKENKKLLQLHNLLPKDKNAKILELGCGMGRLLLTLGELGYSNTLGIDREQPFINIAIKNNLNVLCKDVISFLKQDKNKYDIIFCWDLVEHIDKNLQLDFFTELYNHLNENGYVSIKTINALSPTSSFYRYEDFTHKLSYTPISIKFISNNAGFQDIVIRPEIEENQELQDLKSNYAEIYRKQFFIKDVILTPNIMAILFKSNKTCTEYLQTTPEIKNDYIPRTKTLVIKNIIQYYLNRIFKFISFGKINLFNLNNKKYKFFIHVEETKI